MKKILYLSWIDWFWIKQRPQHISEILSENNKVIYLCRRGWKEAGNVLRNHSDGERILNSTYFNRNANMTVIRKKFLPKEDTFKFIAYINKVWFRNLLYKMNSKNNYDIIIVTHPSQYNFISKHLLDSTIIIYDCMDNYKTFPGCDRRSVLKNEIKLISISDKVIVSSQDLYDEIIKYNKDAEKKMHIINNGVDLQSFSIENIKTDDKAVILRDNGRKRVGYIGTISEWVDLDLIKVNALKNKDVDFYVIGPVDKTVHIEDFAKINNIVFTGVQPYYSIPNILNGMDITIMPFKNNELVQSVNPVKIYEYLAMGKPVIATRYKETEKFGELIYTYGTNEEFESILTRIIKDKDDQEVIDRRIEFAKKNSWKERVNKIEELFL